MTTSGEKMGLTHDNAAELAIQTLIGTAKLLETGMSPEALRKMVNLSGRDDGRRGQGLRGKRAFELVGQALDAARKRAEELASA